jgi:hypothetical protein
MTLRLRFNRRVRILPGVWANLGKRGLNSFSVGQRGSRLTFGRNRTRATIGYPGTGLFLTAEEPTSRVVLSRGFWWTIVLVVIVGTIAIVGL